LSSLPVLNPGVPESLLPANSGFGWTVAIHESSVLAAEFLTFVLKFVDHGDIEQQELTVIKRSEFTS
jgi:hypothetical protein